VSKTATNRAITVTGVEARISAATTREIEAPEVPRAQKTGELQHEEELIRDGGQKLLGICNYK
jgi:hypothetical protein